MEAGRRMGKKIYYILGGLLAFTILIGVACAQKNQVRESERHSPEEETETGNSDNIEERGWQQESVRIFWFTIPEACFIP